MFIQAYKSAFKASVGKKSMLLWGYSLLTLFISAAIAYCFTSFSLPEFKYISDPDYLEYYLNDLVSSLFSSNGIAFIISTAVGFILTVGLTRVYLAALEGREITSDHYFFGFTKTKNVLGAMTWQTIWNVIWSALALIAFAVVVVLFIAIAGATSSSILTVIGWEAFRGASLASSIISIIGVVLGVIVFIPLMILAGIKSYAYIFVPHILATREIGATQALKLSIEMAKGKKLQMFLADLIVFGALFVVTLFLIGFCYIPFMNIIFVIVAIVFIIAAVIYVPVFRELYIAEIFRLKAVPKAPAAPAAPTAPTYPTNNQQ